MIAALDLPFPDEPTPRIVDEDGTVHYSSLKYIALSGRQFLHACNTPTEPTRAMLIGTAVHMLILGPRFGGKRVINYDGDSRRGNEWKAFVAANPDAEILTAPEWDEAEEIADAVMADPIARRRLDGARLEVPLTWEENGIKFSTSGIDILGPGSVTDLKTTSTTYPEAWMRHALRQNNHVQVVHYREGARANGIDVKELYLLGVETGPVHEVVELELSESMIELAVRTRALWIERYRQYRDACPEPRTIRDWPGYAQASVTWDPPAWQMQLTDEDEEAAA